MTLLTDDERRSAYALITRGARYLLIDRRHGDVEPMPRDEAIDFAQRALDGPLTGTWSELTRPASWIKGAFDAWALVVDDNGHCLRLVGVGRHAHQAPS